MEDRLIVIPEAVVENPYLDLLVKGIFAVGVELEVLARQRQCSIECAGAFVRFDQVAHCRWEEVGIGVGVIDDHLIVFDRFVPLLLSVLEVAQGKMRAGDDRCIGVLLEESLKLLDRLRGMIGCLKGLGNPIHGCRRRWRIVELVGHALEGFHGLAVLLTAEMVRTFLEFEERLFVFGIAVLLCEPGCAPFRTRGVVAPEQRHDRLCIIVAPIGVALGCGGERGVLPDGVGVIAVAEEQVGNFPRDGGPRRKRLRLPEECCCNIALPFVLRDLAEGCIGLTGPLLVGPGCCDRCEICPGVLDVARGLAGLPERKEKCAFRCPVGEGVLERSLVELCVDGKCPGVVARSGESFSKGQ